MHDNMDRIIVDQHSDPFTGIVAWSPIKSLWYIGMTLVWLIGGSIYFSWDAVVLYVLFTLYVLLGGHSLGMHRRLIHQSYQCPKWLEYYLVHLGCLVGIAGPYGMVITHDTRDWAQRQKRCHDYFAHRQVWWRDMWWQIHCDLRLANPPRFKLEPEIDTKGYRLLNSTWLLQHIPYAIVFYLLGGWGWVFWGCCGRVTAGISGHWLIGYFAHRGDHRFSDREWHVDGAGVQGYNVHMPFLGFITMGECWHNNHHAFPGSAQIGLQQGQLDPGWWTLKGLEKIGLVWDIQSANCLPPRLELQRLELK